MSVPVAHMRQLEAQLKVAKARIAAVEAENSELHTELEATRHDLQAIIADVRVVALRDAHRQRPSARRARPMILSKGRGSGCSGASTTSSSTGAAAAVAQSAAVGDAGSIRCNPGGGAGSVSMTPATLPTTLTPRRPGIGDPSVQIITTSRQARPNGLVSVQPTRLDLSGIPSGRVQASEMLLHTPGRADGRPAA